MDDSQYDDLIGHRVEVDSVWEPPYERAAYLTLDARVRERCLGDASKRCFGLRDKGVAKPRALVFVPVAGVE